LHGVVADPFGASMCLILVGLFFAHASIRMNLLTIGGLYKKKFGAVSSADHDCNCHILPRLGGVHRSLRSVSFFNVVSAGEISKLAGCDRLGTILIYTFLAACGVAVTDFLQMIIIVSVCCIIGGSVSNMVGGVGVVVTMLWRRASSTSGRLSMPRRSRLCRRLGDHDVWLDSATGRVSAGTVVQDREDCHLGTVFGGCLYFVFAFRADVSGLFGNAD